MDGTQQQGAQPAAKPPAKPKGGKIEKKLFLWLAILVAAWLLYSVAVQTMFPSNGQPEGTVTVSFKALAGEQVVLDKTVSVEKGSNALDEMKKIADVQSSTHPSFGVFVISINGVASTEKSYWALYVDGETSATGISSITLDKDTAIEWRLESFA